ncbi:DMT family transporter [Aliiroseovarius crassostreae]|uniref:DMT family transporter n=1 Tax=Aliiroseovarius crassostreae TaxID=154981 RepID=UPI0022063CF3|nr:DMT family transporter [Aliiroseovarius crassostreae]UWQ07003.1 DMT family transporter [Aliiroseovarius crassostreae]
MPPSLSKNLPNSPHGNLRDNLRGALFMVFSMGAFALEDMALKAAARDIPIGQAVALFGAAGMVIFALMARAQGQRIFHPDLLSPVLIWRSLFEISGRLFYALAIALTPLSSASAILQATPLVVALGAVLVFGERVGLRRWMAIAMGFIGVLMILRPGLDAFDPLSGFAVLGMLGFAGRDLATRASPVSMSSAQLGVAGFAMLTLAGVVLIGFGGVARPTPASLGFVAMASVIGVLAYAALTRAMRVGEVSVVTPFRYSRLLFALILGITVFGEQPDLMTLLGSLVIVSSGVVLLRRPAQGHR